MDKKPKINKKLKFISGGNLKKAPPVPPPSGRVHQGFEGTVDTKFPPLRSQRVSVLFHYFVFYHPSLEGFEARGKEFSGLTICQPSGMPDKLRAVALLSMMKEVMVEILCKGADSFVLSFVVAGTSSPP